MRLCPYAPMPLPLVHHVVLQMAQLELRRQRDQRFGVAEEEVAAVAEAVVEAGDDVLLRGVVEVDDHVAAEDDVEVAEEGDAGLVVEVHAAERNAVADLVGDAPCVVGLAREVLLANWGAGRAERALAVVAAARFREHLLVDVAREDLERGALEVDAFLKED